MADSPAPGRRVTRRRRSALLAHGEPVVWAAGAAVVLALAMIVGLLGLVAFEGGRTFWPSPLVQVRLASGETRLGEVTRTERFRPRDDEIDAVGADHADRARASVAADDGWSRRRLFRTGNFDVFGTHFEWIADFQIVEESAPEWAIVVERLAWGRHYGTPRAFTLDGQEVAVGPDAAWREFERVHDEVRRRRAERRDLEVHEIGAVNRRIEAARLALRKAELDHGADSAEAAALRAATDAALSAATEDFARIQSRIAELNGENDRYRLVTTLSDGQDAELAVADVVRAYPANRLGAADRLGVYLSRWAEFLTDDPREANSEGGVWPAIFGTVTMTLLMTIVVVPFGVLAALYLREYATAGPIVSVVRIAINNLAGVPSIVFGVFGLGFFCYAIGGSLDELFFSAKLPTPTYGTGGLFWAALTLALLTLPVVIVATEEAVAAVPSSQRDGSYGCGASKWQTIRRIVLPRAMPGIMTGAILAMARGAGEVAPLMLVGAVKLAPELPIDGVAPYVHPERSFMHLGFHIYDLGFQSQNSEAARPMVFTTTLLLIAIVVVLNLAAIWLRASLRRRYATSQF